ncbi:mandelate racemase [Kribbella antibiotica]|uniref:Mandelate racemase n=1 Tax=Kribbella antibiotica TaxID=190195 RepID=A0A4R4ZJR9_9ACTN|nr:enolase C-terminal domain-like protein [Kribbella antibiotica]TDD58034.1 mandelate racemase [Kribbella antibiotica]
MDHVVSSISTVQVGARFLRNVGRNSFRDHKGSGALETAYVVATSLGARGWGLPIGPGDPSVLIGRSVDSLIDPAAGVIAADAMFLDYALHDLAARILDVPVHVMLGAAASPQVRCYSGGIYFDDLDDGLPVIEQNLKQDSAFGFRDFKLKVGRGYRWMPAAAGLDRDIAVTRLTRDLYPDATIMVDANDGYSLNTLIHYLDAVADCDLYWLEEMFAERHEDLVFLREHLSRWPSRPLIADGEYSPNVDHILSLAREGLIDVALMDVVSHGLTAWRHTMPSLAAKASPHAWGLPLKTLYAAHLAAGLGNVDIIEGVPANTLGTVDDGYTLADGVLTLADRPGFGIDLA